jgi:hypothetical protein
VKVFLSSVISGFESYREAAVRAIENLGHQVILAEDFPAVAGSAQQACLDGVRRSDLTVLILGERYGDRQASGYAATHEEFLEARGRAPLLVFVHDIKRDSDQEEFVREVQRWDSGHLTAHFKTEADLQRAVIGALHAHELNAARGSVNESEMLQRALDAIPSRSQQTGLYMVVAGGPTQQLVRPGQLEDPAFESNITKHAFFDIPVLDRTQSTNHQIRDHRLQIYQHEASLTFDPTGVISVRAPLQRGGRERGWVPSLIEEEVMAQIKHGLQFGSWLLDEVDPTHRITDLVPIAALVGHGHLGWQTRAEQAASPGSVTMGKGSEVVAVHLAPPSRRRGALSNQVDEIAEDLTVLLRREMR